MKVYALHMRHEGALQNYRPEVLRDGAATKERPACPLRIGAQNAANPLRGS